MRLASQTRSDQRRVIRQLHERLDGQEMADLLIFLEEWQDKSKYLHAALADLRKSAATERKDLESYTAKRR